MRNYPPFLPSWLNLYKYSFIPIVSNWQLATVLNSQRTMPALAFALYHLSSIAFGAVIYKGAAKTHPHLRALYDFVDREVHNPADHALIVEGFHREKSLRRLRLSQKLGATHFALHCVYTSACLFHEESIPPVHKAVVHVMLGMIALAGFALLYLSIFESETMHTRAFETALRHNRAFGQQMQRVLAGDEERKEAEPAARPGLLVAG